MVKRTMEAEVKRRAEAAAKARAEPGNKLKRSEALAEAPWPKDLPVAWERAFRMAYADRLVLRGFAIDKGRPGGKSNSPPGETDLVQCKLYLLPKEYAEQRAKAKAVDLKWSTWARRKLSE